MIVTCEQCATQFQLDDAKVPVGGVRVRCSRCKHAFFIEPAGAELPQSPLDRATQEALDAQAPPEPEATEDLAEADAAAGSDFSHDGDLSDENEISDESDWEFNEDRFRSDTVGAEEHADAPDPAREAIDDLLSARPAPRASAAHSADESWSQPTAFAADADDEDLGSPESWDLLANDSSPGASAASAELAADTLLAASPAPREPQRSVGASAARPEIEEWIDPSEPSRLLAWVARSGHAIGWGVTVTLFALVAFATLGPGAASEAESGFGTQRLAQLEAQGIAGRWVENAAAGPLFVVSGRLVNPSSAPQPLGALAGVRLLDASGARLVTSEPAALGSVIEPRELREAPPSALQARQLEAGRMLAETAIEPGQSLAFEAVLSALPAAAERFVLEPIAQGRAASLAAASEPAPAH